MYPKRNGLVGAPLQSQSFIPVYIIYYDIILVTAYRQETQNLVEEAIRQNVYACLYKPFDTQKLIAIIEGILAAKAKAEIQQIGGD